MARCTPRPWTPARQVREYETGLLTLAATDILGCVCRLSGVAASALLGREHTPSVSLTRAVAVYLLRKERHLNAHQVARVFGRTRQWASWFTSTLDQKFASSRDAANLVEAARERLKGGGESSTLPLRQSAAELPGLSAYRLAAGLSQAELAARAGVSRQTIIGIERHRRAVRFLTIEALARALGVRPDTLGDARLDSCAMEVLLAYGRIGARRCVKPKPPLRICTDCGEDKLLAAFVRLPAHAASTAGAAPVARSVPVSGMGETRLPRERASSTGGWHAEATSWRLRPREIGSETVAVQVRAGVAQTDEHVRPGWLARSGRLESGRTAAPERAAPLNARVSACDSRSRPSTARRTCQRTRGSNRSCDCSYRRV
jgi:transcriptional regulator with XRE-family HTH domain